jgi:Phage tail sheath protein subtilisin-like domain/ATPase family associated with various cellular activities (AAA)/Phage tail sheath C-terminal domain
MDFTERFGDSVTAPEPAVRAQWTLDAVDGGQWWHFGLAVKGFFDNGGQRLYVKRVVCDDPASLGAADFVNALEAFERFDAISIVLAPGIWSVQVQAALIAQCEARGRCFAVLDAPADADVEQARAFRAQRHSRFAALYYPWVDVLDPRTAQRVTVPASAHVAGVYARVDRERGVFRAPANETLHGIESLAGDVTHAAAEPLDHDGINALRALGGTIKVWGARTISGGEWNYVNVRRLLVFIEESIAKGTQWVVFEPNGEPLWAQLRRSVLQFLLNLWRAGGLAGSTPEQAFVVRCDRTTMTQDDIDQARLICEVGVAPLRPAEFVIVRIGQWTADRKGPCDAADDDRLIDPPYVRCESIGDCALLREAIGLARRVGTLILVSGADRNARAAAAHKLARLAQRPFHWVDLSRVVSKYVGETTRNFDRIFDAAAKSDVVLFFDEADALFGKRAEVHDAHDRNTNIEVAYLLQRIEAFAGVVTLATNRRRDLPAAVRRFARLGVGAAQTAIETTPLLPDLSSAVDLEVVATNLRAIQALYFAAMLEELALFRAVDRLVELFMQGQLPLGAGDARTRLSEYGKRSANRLSEAQRRELYARVFGIAGGEGGTTPNREFDTLWIRFVSAVASWVRPGDNDALRTAARDLAINLSLHGCGLSLYAANELAVTLRDAIAILADPDVRAAYGARDMWQLIDQVATLELGDARNAVRYRTMAAAGAVVIAWLAKHLERLAPSSTAAVLELSESPSASNCRLGPQALSQPTDADLVIACANWLAVAAASPTDADGSSVRAEAPFAGVPGDFAAFVAALLATNR